MKRIAFLLLLFNGINTMPFKNKNLLKIRKIVILNPVYIILNEFNFVIKNKIKYLKNII